MACLSNACLSRERTRRIAGAPFYRGKDAPDRRRSWRGAFFAWRKTSPAFNKECAICIAPMTNSHRPIKLSGNGFLIMHELIQLYESKMNDDAEAGRPRQLNANSGSGGWAAESASKALDRSK